MGLLTDASSYRDWNPSIVSLDGEITPGGKIALVSTVNPKRTFKLKVTEMTTPTRMIWSDGMPLGLFKGERTYRLVERIGSTEFSMTEDFTGPLAGPSIWGKPISCATGWRSSTADLSSARVHQRR